MKIAINTRFLLSRKLEGLGWYTYEVVRRMVLNHPEDEFYFLFDRPFDPQFIFAQNVKPIVVAPPARHPILWYCWFEWALPQKLSKIKPDVFYSPDGYCSISSQIPTVMVSHDIAHVHYPKQIPFLVRQYYDYYTPRYLQRADHIISISAFNKQDLLTHYPVTADRISIIPNGVRNSFAPTTQQMQGTIRQEYSHGKPYFFFLGAIHPRKNMERLLLAFDQFKKDTSSEVQLLVGGRMAWQTGAIKETLHRLEHQSSVHFLGYLPEERLSPIMGSAIALVYPSLFEGFGLPILEAFHCDIPVITSNRSALPEVAGKAALLIDPTNIKAMAQAMQKLWFDPVLRKKLVTAAQTQRQQFNWDNTAQKTYQILQQVAKNP